MRAALISLAGQPRDADGSAMAVAGKSVAQRQLEFALAAGSERIIALGDGASAEAIGLRHGAERAGARFEAVRDGHGLLGAVRAGDELLVLAPGLVPEAAVALEAVTGSAALLVLPVGAGVAAGFERIDLERAWAGALVVPGSSIERLGELPADSEPAAALLRIALQSRVAERRLPEAVLADGSWIRVPAGAGPDLTDRAWLRRNLPPAARFSLSEQLALAGWRAFGLRLLPMPRAVAVLQAGSVLLVAVGAGFAWRGYAGVGFAMVALGALVAAFAAAGTALRCAPFRKATGRWQRGMTVLADVALLAAGAGAITGDWAHRVFPPVVLVAALRAGRFERSARVTALVGDRAIVALLLAAAGALGWAEHAIMALGVVVLALSAADAAATRG